MSYIRRPAQRGKSRNESRPMISINNKDTHNQVDHDLDRAANICYYNHTKMKYQRLAQASTEYNMAGAARTDRKICSGVFFLVRLICPINASLSSRPCIRRSAIRRQRNLMPFGLQASRTDAANHAGAIHKDSHHVCSIQPYSGRSTVVRMPAVRHAPVNRTPLDRSFDRNDRTTG